MQLFFDDADGAINDVFITERDWIITSFILENFLTNWKFVIFSCIEYQFLIFFTAHKTDFQFIFLCNFL